MREQNRDDFKFELARVLLEECGCYLFNTFCYGDLVQRAWLRDASLWEQQINYKQLTLDG